MIRKLRKRILFIIIKLLGDDDMMAMFFAQRVILGKTAWKDVPETLKPGAYEILVESGVEFLAEGYEPPIKA